MGAYTLSNGAVKEKHVNSQGNIGYTNGWKASRSQTSARVFS